MRQSHIARSLLPPIQKADESGQLFSRFRRLLLRACRTQCRCKQLLWITPFARRIALADDLLARLIHIFPVFRADRVHTRAARPVELVAVRVQHISARARGRTRCAICVSAVCIGRRDGRGACGSCSGSRGTTCVLSASCILCCG